MSEWIDGFVKNYETYKNITECLNKNSIDKQVVCLLRLNAPKKKKRKKRARRGY